MVKEVFKPIPGFEGYEVSNLGNVKSLKYKKPKILKQQLSRKKDGYYQVSLSIGVRKQKKVHQLVAMAFLNHIPNRYTKVVDHVNNINTDNRLENLQIISQRENCSKDKKGATSRYTGVRKKHNKWEASIKIKGKDIYLGTYNTELEASNTYQKELTKIKL